MAVSVTLNQSGTNFLDYLETTFEDGYQRAAWYGFFDDDMEQFAGTETLWATPFDQGFLVEGDFGTYTTGDLTGYLDTIRFGFDITGSASAGYDLTDTDVTLGFGHVDVDTTLDYVIYGLMNSDTDPLQAYFDTVGVAYTGSAGNDTLQGFDAADTFTFDGTDGSDVVNGFTVGEDTIEFVGLWTDYADYADAVDDGDVVLGTNTITYGSNVITVTGVDVSTLDADDFAFA